MLGYNWWAEIKPMRLDKAIVHIEAARIAINRNWGEDNTFAETIKQLDQASDWCDGDMEALKAVQEYTKKRIDDFTRQMYDDLVASANQKAIAKKLASHG